jgi:L-threonylcarbamoyladenylate synthase
MTTIIKINPEKPEPDRIDGAVALLKKGGVIAFPTETFYGLGADARNEAAIEKIFGIKGRDFKNPILVVIGDVRHLEALDDVPRSAKAHEPVLARAADDRLPGGIRPSRRS